MLGSLLNRFMLGFLLNSLMLKDTSETNNLQLSLLPSEHSSTHVLNFNSTTIVAVVRNTPGRRGGGIQGLWYCSSRDSLGGPGVLELGVAIIKETQGPVSFRVMLLVMP